MKAKKSYLPLVVLVVISVLMAWALSSFDDLMISIRYVMGSFLCLLSMLKFFDLKGFKAGYVKYDLLAKHVPYYGYVYPFIELALGLGFYTGQYLLLVSLITLFFMVFGAFGVFKAVQSKKELTCACMGSVIKLPLTAVSFFEDIVMGVMSLMLIFMVI